MKYMHSAQAVFWITLELCIAYNSQATSIEGEPHWVRPTEPITIDFTSVPNGTPASANNPRGGIMNIQSQTGVDRGASVPPFDVEWTEATIQDGALAAVPDYTLIGNYFYSKTRITFSEPVTDVSFMAWCWRVGGYGYSGIDKNGASFTGGGAIPGLYDGGVAPPATGWVTFTCNIPEGGYLTELDISNQDPLPGDAGIWINNITFAPVPEPTTMTLLGLGVLGMWFLRRGPKNRAR